MPQTFSSFAEAKAECPDGWRVDAVVDQYDPTTGIALSHLYFPFPPGDLDMDFKDADGRLITMKVGDV